MAQLRTFIAFFILNFGALYIGGLFTGTGVTSDWYNNLNQAPWTPPGYVFGIAWTSIMICFSHYMSVLYRSASNRKNILRLFALQWILNVSWNPVFFQFHLTGFALILISLLTLSIALFLALFTDHNRASAILLMPYLIWLIMATSLNSYIFLNN